LQALSSNPSLTKKKKKEERKKMNGANLQDAIENEQHKLELVSTSHNVARWLGRQVLTNSNSAGPVCTISLLALKSTTKNISLSPYLFLCKFL
jgi:hypothetical protein